MRKSASSAKMLVAKCCLPGDPRTSAVLSIFDEMLQQHNGLLQLCDEAEFHGAIQQGRKLILNLYRGIWICHCASDAQFGEKSTHPFSPRSAFRMTHEIDASCRSISDAGDLQKPVWRILGKYSYLELEQIRRRKTRHSIEPTYSDELVGEAALTCINCLLLLAEVLLRPMGILKPLKKLRQRGTSTHLRKRLKHLAYHRSVCVWARDFTRLDTVDGMRWLGFWLH